MSRSLFHRIATTITTVTTVTKPLFSQNPEIYEIFEDPDEMTSVLRSHLNRASVSPASSHVPVSYSRKAGPDILWMYD